MTNNTTDTLSHILFIFYKHVVTVTGDGTHNMTTIQDKYIQAHGDLFGHPPKVGKGKGKENFSVALEKKLEKTLLNKKILCKLYFWLPHTYPELYFRDSGSINPLG